MRHGTIKADTIKNKKSLAINLPNKLKIGGFLAEQGYTASGTEPSSAAIGDFWWDTANEKLYRYVDGEFKEFTLVAVSRLIMGINLLGRDLVQQIQATSILLILHHWVTLHLGKIYQGLLLVVPQLVIHYMDFSLVGIHQDLTALQM